MWPSGENPRAFSILFYRTEDYWGGDRYNGTQVNYCWAKLMKRSCLLGNPELKWHLAVTVFKWVDQITKVNVNA